MKCEWKDLPKPLSCFTVMNTTMINLNTGKTVQHYATNTKIVVTQKCITPDGTYYRTGEAAYHYLNYAFKASAFGLPDEKAPSAPSKRTTPNSLSVKRKKSGPSTQPTKKIKKEPTVVIPNGGEGRQHRNWFSKLFRRKNG